MNVSFFVWIHRVYKCIAEEWCHTITVCRDYKLSKLMRENDQNVYSEDTQITGNLRYNSPGEHDEIRLPEFPYN